MKKLKEKQSSNNFTKKNLFLFLVVFAIIFLYFNKTSASGLPIFPGAGGFGSETRAAYGGLINPVICKVTNLNDSGSGSLRECIAITSPRVVIFEVSGYINLESKLNIESPYLTIAGQTAPSPGITLRGYNLRVRTHDVLIQHIAVRVGGYNFGSQNHCNHACETLQVIQVQDWHDKRMGDNVYNVVLDHISLSWGSDSNFNTWYGAHDITLSNSIISEPLNKSCHCELEYKDGDEGVQAHGYNIDFGSKSKNITVYKNLFAHGTQRNPMVNKEQVELIWANNLIYNYNIGWNISKVSEFKGSVAGNVYKTGPSLENYYPFSFVDLIASQDFKIYVNDNVEIDSSPHSKLYYFKDCLEPDQNYFSSTPPIWRDDLRILLSSQVEDYLKTNAGSRPADRDQIDNRVLGDVANLTGSIIDWETDIGGFPNLTQNIKKLVIPEDPHTDSDGNGYANLEEWLFSFSCVVEGENSLSCGRQSIPSAPSGLQVW